MDEKEFELAQAITDAMIEDGIKKAQDYRPLPATGNCWNCEAQVVEGALFCDPECQEDWTKRTKRTP